MSCEERRPLALNDLIGSLRMFKDERRLDTRVEVRWLCSAISPLLDAAEQVNNNKLDDDYRRSVNTFRAAELDAQILDARRETEAFGAGTEKVRRRMKGGPTIVVLLWTAILAAQVAIFAMFIVWYMGSAYPVSIGG